MREGLRELEEFWRVKTKGITGSEMEKRGRMRGRRELLCFTSGHVNFSGIYEVDRHQERAV